MIGRENENNPLIGRKDQTTTQKAWAWLAGFHTGKSSVECPSKEQNLTGEEHGDLRERKRLNHWLVQFLNEATLKR